MTLDEFAVQYGGLLMACFATGWAVGFLIKMFRRYLEKI